MSLSGEDARTKFVRNEVSESKILRNEVTETMSLSNEVAESKILRSVKFIPHYVADSGPNAESVRVYMDDESLLIRVFDAQHDAKARYERHGWDEEGSTAMMNLIIALKTNMREGL